MEPTDAAEGSEPSVFALLQSKREPVTAAASKGKFVPKVKARPGARATQPSAGSVPLLKVKTEPNVVKPEPMDDGPLLEVKEEPQDDARGKMKLDLDMSEEPIEEVKEEPINEVKEEPNAKDEVAGLMDEPMFKEPVVSTPGVDRVVREIDVFLTPHVDPETNVR